MIRILLTGATGFLGSSLLGKLCQDLSKYQITILKRSKSNTSRIKHLLNKINIFDIDEKDIGFLFSNNQFDIVIHCATDYGRRVVNLSEIVETNLLLPLRLLESSLINGVRVFINTDTMLNKNVSNYTLSKRHFRDWLENLSNNLVCINVSLEHFFGPGDNNSKFVTHIIQLLLLETHSIPLTFGEQMRDFIYIDDVVSAFVVIIDDSLIKYNGFIEYEVGTGISISVKDFVCLTKRLCENANTELKFGEIEYRLNEQMKVIVNNAKLQSLGWEPKYTLEQGLILTIENERASLI